MSRARRFFYLACALVLLAGAMARSLFANREFILDEAWVANSVLSPDLRSMFFYPEWLQTTPPLFLLWLRFTVQSIGLSHTTLELPAMISGLGAVVGIAWIGGKRFGLTWRWLAISLVALSPTAIFYSTACKQYSGELFAAVLLLAVLVAGKGRAWPVRSAMLLGAGVVAVLLAYGSVFILPGIALWLLVAPEGGNRWKRLPWIVGVMGILGAIFVLEYVFYIRPNTNEELRHFWSPGPVHSLRAVWAHFNQYMAVAENHFVRLEGPGSWRRGQMIGFTAMAIYFVGSYAMWRDRQCRWLLWKSMLVWELPLVLLVAADAVGVFPFAVRTSLFLIPGLTLALVRRAEFTALLLRQGAAQPLRWRLALGTAMVVMAGLAMWTSLYEGGAEQSSVAYQQLKAMAKEDDVVLVHRSMQQQFELEGKLQGPVRAHVVWGATGPGCCARGPEPPPSTADAVSADLGAATQEHPRRIWFYHTMREGLWEYLGLDEPKVVDQYLRAHGYLAKHHTQLRLVGVDGYELVDGTL